MALSQWRAREPLLSCTGLERDWAQVSIKVKNLSAFTQSLGKTTQPVQSCYSVLTQTCPGIQRAIYDAKKMMQWHLSQNKANCNYPQQGITWTVLAVQLWQHFSPPPPINVPLDFSIKCNLWMVLGTPHWLTFSQVISKLQNWHNVSSLKLRFRLFFYSIFLCYIGPSWTDVSMCHTGLWKLENTSRHHYYSVLHCLPGHTLGGSLGTGTIQRRLCIFSMNWCQYLIGQGGMVMSQAPLHAIGACFAFIEKNANCFLNSTCTDRVTSLVLQAAGQLLGMEPGIQQRIL